MRHSLFQYVNNLLMKNQHHQFILMPYLPTCLMRVETRGHKAQGQTHMRLCICGSRVSMVLWIIMIHWVVAKVWGLKIRTHWGPVMHICLTNLYHHWFRQWLVVCLVPSQYLNQCCIMSTGPLGTNLSQIVFEIQIFSFKKMHLKMLSGKYQPICLSLNVLTHWGRVTHICVAYLTIIASDNGLSPSQRQAIIWTNAGILLIRPLGTNFSEILIDIHTFSFKKMHLKMLFAKRRPFCLNLNVLMQWRGNCTRKNSSDSKAYTQKCHKFPCLLDYLKQKSICDPWNNNCSNEWGCFLLYFDISEIDNLHIICSSDWLGRLFCLE